MFGRGLGLLLVGYLPAVGVGFDGQDKDGEYLYYPVAGPWMYLARGEHDNVGTALLVIDGIVQDLGALQIVLAVLWPREANTKRTASATGNERVQVTPRFSRYQADTDGKDGYQMGMTARGRF